MSPTLRSSMTPLLTIRQAADLMQLSEKTIRRRIDDGSLIAHKLGAVWRLAPRDVEDYLRRARHVQ